MALKPVVTFRSIRQSVGLVEEVQRRVVNLEKFYQPITSCRVLVEMPEGRKPHGERYRIQIHLSVPGGEIMVSHQPAFAMTPAAAEPAALHKRDEPEPDHKHAREAIRDAFQAARRQLQAFSRKQRGVRRTSRPVRAAVS